jgi:hypothetical protein
MKGIMRANVVPPPIPGRIPTQKPIAHPMSMYRKGFNCKLINSPLMHASYIVTIVSIGFLPFLKIQIDLTNLGAIDKPTLKFYVFAKFFDDILRLIENII